MQREVKPQYLKAKNKSGKLVKNILAILLLANMTDNIRKYILYF